MKRKPEIMCEYGNCSETMKAGEGYKLTITETRKGMLWERKSFCCMEHGWRWLKHRDERLNGKREAA
jgi:hypothetical protein